MRMRRPLERLGPTACALAALAFATPWAVAAQDATRAQTARRAAQPAHSLTFTPASRIWVEGTSTVRPYRCEATRIDALIEAEPAAATAAGLALAGLVRGATIAIPVDALDCRNRQMNEHMRKALRAQEHPRIEFRLDGHRLAPAPDGTADVELHGTLVIAGTPRPVTIAAGAEPAPDGGLRVIGTYRLDMTEYGVKPPRLMLGTLKVHDRAVVHFDVTVR